MKNFFIIFLIIFLGFEIKSNEPFVILEYNSQNLNNELVKKISIKTISSLKIITILLTIKLKMVNHLVEFLINIMVIQV